MAKWSLIVVLVIIGAGVYAVRDEVRTLQSLRRVPGTNAYVMDYYGDYNLDEIRRCGVDIQDVDDSLIGVYFPPPLDGIARRGKHNYVQRELRTVDSGAHHCSTVMLHNSRGETIFGRNFDWKHRTCLILKVHRAGKVASVSVIDLAYLDLERDDLEQLSLLARVPLLFAPYYLMDGMNEHGVAISDMSLSGAQPPYDPEKPDLLHSIAMRLVLDYATNTREAVELLSQYNIHFAETTCHLLVADAGGDSAVVEFLDGAMRVTHSNRKWQACTNCQIYGSSESALDDRCERYSTASQQLESLGGGAGAEEVSAIMNSVAARNWTMWTSVYNLQSGEFSVLPRKPSGGPYYGKIDVATKLNSD